MTRLTFTVTVETADTRPGVADRIGTELHRSLEHRFLSAEIALVAEETGDA